MRLLEKACYVVATIHTFPLTAKLWYYKTISWCQHVRQAFEYYRQIRLQYKIDLMVETHVHDLFPGE